MKATKGTTTFTPVRLEIVFETEEELEVFSILMSKNTSLSNHVFELNPVKQSTLEQVMGDIWDAL